MARKQNTDKMAEISACKNARVFRNPGNLIRKMYAHLFMSRYASAGKIMAVLTIVHLCLCAWAGAEELSGTEYRVKAGFIYHFIRFTQWPADTFAKEESPIVLCVAAEQGPDILGSLHSKMIQKRRIEVQQYAQSGDTDQICQILFVAASAQAGFPDLPQGPVLTIGETEEFGKKGGIVRFFTEKERLRFAVNLRAARNAGLRMSSQLLMSAEIATEAP